MKRRETVLHGIAATLIAGLAMAPVAMAPVAMAPVAIAQVAAAEDAAPQRIVVAGGDLTEIIYALGEQSRIVGVDVTATHPPEASSKAQIGYVRNIAPEGVLSLSPDLLLAAHDAGPAVAMERLEAAGVPIAKAPETPSAASIADKIMFVGKAIGAPDKAKALATRFRDDLSAVTDKVGAFEADKPRVLFILSARSGAPLVGGSDTEADEMIRLAGGENAGAAIDGYKPMSREAILAAAPEVILMMTHHAGRMGGIDAVIDRPEIALTPAGQARRAVTMDGMFLLGFGPRTPEAIAQLARKLHPEAAEKAGL
ncbi:MAG: ABC transporter substrate-binding protein [Pseudomonadota bacterium]